MGWFTAHRWRKRVAANLVEIIFEAVGIPAALWKAEMLGCDIAKSKNCDNFDINT